MEFRVVGIDTDGGVICQSADGETYNSGLSLAEFGSSDLDAEERRAVGITGGPNHG